MRKASILLFVAGCSWASTGRAGETHYQSFHVGERAAGMAGAFTALADEATGAFYNPAGILDAGTTSLGVNVSAYQLQARTFENQFSIGETQGNLSARDFTSFPAGFGFVRAFGERIRQALALTIVVPDNDVLVGKVGLSGATIPASGGNPQIDNVAASASFRQTDQTLWFGAAYAVRPHSSISLGAGLFYLLRHFQLVTSSLAQGDAQGTLVGESEATRFEALHGSLALDLGLKLRLADHLRIGLSFRTANLRVHRSATGFKTTGRAEPILLGGPELELESNDPFRVALGVAWEVPRRYALSLDLRVHGSVSPYDPVIRRATDGSTGPDPDFNRRLERGAVLNVSAGGEYYVSSQVVARGGFYTNFTSVPALREAPELVGVDRVHLYGIAAAVGWVRERTSLTLSVNYAFGFGDVVGQAGGSTPTAQPLISGASRQMLTVLLGGSYRL